MPSAVEDSTTTNTTESRERSTPSKCRHPNSIHRMSAATMLLVAVLALTFADRANADIFVYTLQVPQLLIEEFHDLPARFGPSLSDSGLQVVLTAGMPPTGCKALNKPPRPNPMPNPANDTVGLPYAVILARGECAFIEKVRNAQAAGYAAVIVHNVDSNNLEPMSAKDADGITIPSVFVGELAGRILMANYQYQQDYLLVLNGDVPFDINTNLILPFSVVVGLCFVIMMGIIIMKCVREQRRLRRHRLPRSALRALPVVRFNKATMTYETCVICLDDFTFGEKIRVLPCDHAYHCKCIDEWLTKNRRVCPICKRKVMLRRNPRRSASATAAAAAATATGPPSTRDLVSSLLRQPHRSSDDSSSDSDADDSTPLLNPVEHSAANSSNHGTFSAASTTSTSAGAGQRVNPFDRTPNLPAHLQEDIEPQPIWYRRWFTFFHREAHVVPPTPLPVPALFTPIPSTVVQLDYHHHDDGLNNGAAAGDDDDDASAANTLRSQNIYEPPRATMTSSSSLLSQSLTAAAAAAGGEPQPSSSHQARLGVAAIPNLEFSPPSPPSSSSRRGNAKPPNDFIV